MLRTLRTLAKTHAVELELVREGGAHSVYRCGPAQFTVPRHTQINEKTARAIFRYVSEMLDDEQGR